jgi:DNA polymerase V
MGRVTAATRHLIAPLYLDRISAGFPSPAENYLEGSLDLNAFLVRNPAATFMVRVGGDSMTGAGICEGDILIVDRPAVSGHGKIVVAVLEGELTVKRLHFRGGQRLLLADNPSVRAVRIGEDQELQIWGVVVGVVRRVGCR